MNKNISTILIGLLLTGSILFNAWLLFFASTPKPVAPAAVAQTERVQPSCPPAPTLTKKPCICPPDPSRVFAQMTAQSALARDEDAQMKAELKACFEKEYPRKSEKPEAEMNTEEKRNSLMNHCIDKEPESCSKFLVLLDEECKRGTHESCVHMAHMLAKGRAGVPADPKEAISLLEESCSGNDREACTELGRYLEKGLTGIPPDVTRAMNAFQTSCGMGKGFDCDEVGRLLEQKAKDQPEKATESLQYYQKACDAGNSMGCYHAFSLQQTGIGTEAEKQAMEQKMIALCDKQDPYACRGLVNKYASQSNASPSNSKPE